MTATALPTIDSVLGSLDARAASATGGRWLFYGLNFAPELTGIGKYTGEMAERLVRQGHAVTVVTAYPYYPHWRLDPARPNWRWSTETWRGVRVIRCPLWVPSRPAALTRILHLLSFALSSAPAVLYAALRHRPETLFVVEPTSFAAPMGLLAARLAGRGGLAARAGPRAGRRSQASACSARAGLRARRGGSTAGSCRASTASPR